MHNTEQIKTTIERTKKALLLKPSLGKGTGVSKVKVSEGLRCEIEEGNWKFYADMPEGAGGKGSAPTPGVYGRAALGACLAIGYMMKAAELQLRINNLEVTVEADFDDGALFGTADKTIPPGYLEVRYTITIESDETDEAIMQMINEGDLYSPYLDIFSRAQKCVRKINIISK
ncbi:OsmC family protein [Lacibacter luteus]|nr:OsmC family protein [Lacibacter luteus]